MQTSFVVSEFIKACDFAYPLYYIYSSCIQFTLHKNASLTGSLTNVSLGYPSTNILP